MRPLRGQRHRRGRRRPRLLPLSDDTRAHERNLEWEGCLNARDLGGLPTRSGHETRYRQVVRSDNPAYLTAAGWSSLLDYGVRTIIALRTIGANDDEPEQPPEGIALEHVPIEDGTDAEFVERCVVNGWFCSPLFFATMLDHWPDRCAAHACIADALERFDVTEVLLGNGLTVEDLDAVRERLLGSASYRTPTPGA